MDTPDTAEIQSSLRRALSALDALGNTRRRAEHSILSGIRREIGWMPFANVGLSLADYLSRRHREWEERLILEARRRLLPATASRVEPNGQGGSEAWPSGSAAADPARSSIPTLRLRLSVPSGPKTVSMPIAIQNHRDTPDAITVSLRPPVAGVTPFPLNRVYVDPDRLIIPARSSASVNLVLNLDPSLDVAKEYWSEILISGLEVKRIGLALRFDLANAPGEEPVSDGTGAS
jgi:hypothetical protein